MAFSLFNWFLFLISWSNLFCGSTPDTHNFLASVTCVKIKLYFFFACHVSFLPLTICHHSPGCPCGSNEHGSSMWLVLVCENQQATCHENSFPGLFKETESSIHQHPHCSHFGGTSVSSYLAWGHNQWTYFYVFYRLSVWLWPSHSVPQFPHF